jgi:hypothetical protein
MMPTVQWFELSMNDTIKLLTLEHPLALDSITVYSIEWFHNNHEDTGKRENQPRSYLDLRIIHLIHIGMMTILISSNWTTFFDFS